MATLEIHPQAQNLELAAECLAYFDFNHLRAEGATDVWVDIPAGMLGAASHITAGQQRGLEHTLKLLLAKVNKSYPLARIVVAANGNAIIYQR